MNTNLKPLIPLVLWAVCGTAWAEPTLYPPDVRVLSNVLNQTDSNILADEADPRTVWVLPPNTAQATVSKPHSKTASMIFCQDLRQQAVYAREISAQIHSLSKKRLAREADLLARLQKANKLREEAEGFAAEKNLQVLSDLDTRISEADDRLQELYEAANNCAKACDEIEHETRHLIDAKKDMLKIRNQMTKENTADLKEYGRRKKKADAAYQSYKNELGFYREMTAELAEVRNSFLQGFQTFGAMEGSKATFSYRSHWNDNIEKLRAANPGINFAKMATKNAVVMTELSGLTDYDPSSAIKGIMIGGEIKKGAVNYPNYPESLSTNVVLSLMGACPMEHPEYFDLKENSAESMQYGLVMTYDYDTVFRVKATAKYNMYKMYQKIVSSGSKGGFFRSKSWSSVEERNFFRDSFSVVWSDQENSLSTEQKDEIEQEMRRNIMQRLANLALPDSPSRGDVLAALPPPQRGAAVVSDQLMKTCPGNAYCVGAAVVFRIMDAIWGSSSSTSSYTNIKDFELVEDYERTQKITKSWITSYLK